jgi:hypothetical protein
VGGCHSAQDCAYPGVEFFGVKGLWEIVIGADLQAVYAVAPLPSCRQHQHRHFRVLAKPLQDFKPIEAGQHDIKNDEVESLSHSAIQPLISVIRGLDRKAMLF